MTETDILETSPGHTPSEEPPAEAATASFRVGPLLDRFREAYPRAFSHPRRPFKIGIHRDILERHPDLNPKHLGMALRVWVLSTSYLSAVSRGQPRIDLEGNLCGTPTAEEIAHAGLELARRTGAAPRQPKPLPLGANSNFRRAKTILNAAKLGDPLAPEERDFMLTILARHPEADRKTAGGVADILVQEHRQGGSRCFFVRRGDGGTDSFSLAKCFEAPPPAAPDTPPHRRPKPLTAKPLTAEVVEATVRAKSAKVTVPIRVELFPRISVPEGANAPAGVDLMLKTGETELRATINRKSFRKVCKTIGESQAGTFVLVQGSLGPNGVILEAGMAVQPPRGEALAPGKA